MRSCRWRKEGRQAASGVGFRVEWWISDGPGPGPAWLVEYGIAPGMQVVALG
ncbi:MAG: hypothetical protein MUP90_04960 [Gammaproteobacteria bacterium]|nr:hypothetical protein [Gammaproteobacteria bacterium]